MQTVKSIWAVSYSQFREDIQILKYFGPDYIGTYVDIGANDGVTGSNTYLLELYGWRGLLIEPNTRLANVCRRERPNSTVITKAAVGNPDIQSVDFYEYYGLLPTGENYDGLSTVGKRSHLDTMAIEGGASVEKKTVPAATIENILSEIRFTGTIDFISLDVEGLELEVLKGIDLNKRKPKLFLIEDNTRGADRSIEAYLIGFGYYRVHRTGVNDWYVDSQATKRFYLQRLILKFRLVSWAVRRALVSSFVYYAQFTSLDMDLITG
jgi:FkbM family methyltransferase